MRKTLSICLIVFLLMTCLTSCNIMDGLLGVYYSLNIPNKDRDKETTLDFWICENVDDYDWSGHDEIFGWFGASEFLGKRYRLTYNEEEQRYEKPKFYVSYVVTNYPDYSSPSSCVTRIDITDPTVKVYGLTTKSTLLEFIEVFSDLGYDISKEGSNADGYIKAEKNGITFYRVPGNDERPTMIKIRAYISNMYGIMY